MHLPDVESLVIALEDLIKHPEKIKEIGLAAQDFVDTASQLQESSSAVSRHLELA